MNNKLYYEAERFSYSKNMEMFETFIGSIALRFGGYIAVDEKYVGNIIVIGYATIFYFFLFLKLYKRINNFI